jgi:hypothetical protein
MVASQGDAVSATQHNVTPVSGLVSVMVLGTWDAQVTMHMFNCTTKNLTIGITYPPAFLPFDSRSNHAYRFNSHCTGRVRSSLRTHFTSLLSSPRAGIKSPDREPSKEAQFQWSPWFHIHEPRRSSRMICFVHITCIFFSILSDSSAELIFISYSTKWRRHEAKWPANLKS